MHFDSSRIVFEQSVCIWDCPSIKLTHGCHLLALVGKTKHPWSVLESDGRCQSLTNHWFLHLLCHVDHEWRFANTCSQKGCTFVLGYHQVVFYNLIWGDWATRCSLWGHPCECWLGLLKVSYLLKVAYLTCTVLY